MNGTTRQALPPARAKAPVPPQAAAPTMARVQTPRPARASARASATAFRRLVRLACAVGGCLVLLVAPLAAAVPAAAAATPTVAAAPAAARPGGTVTVTGTGWKPGTLLAILLCGQNAIGGTNACANATGRAATTDSAGRFSRQLPVAAPPKPCPCVIHVSTVTGEQLTVDAPFTVTGHPVAPLPEQTGTGRIAVLTARLRGGSGLLTWFGAPAKRTLEFTVGNLGSAPVKDPFFDIGTAHGVYGPQWDRRQWHGTVAPGGEAKIAFPVELSSGAHGGYTVRLRYGGRQLVSEPWSVGRPWGVTLFWILLFLVVPAAVFRIGMLVVDRLRPRAPRAPEPGGSGARGSAGGHRRGRAAAWHPAALRAYLPSRAPGGAPGESAAPRSGFLGQLSAPRRRLAPRPRPHPQQPPPPPAAAPLAEAVETLPWFTHDALPALRTSAPDHDERPPSKGSS